MCIRDRVYTMFDPKLLDGVQTVHFIGCGDLYKAADRMVGK